MCIVINGHAIQSHSIFFLIIVIILNLSVLDSQLHKSVSGNLSSIAHIQCTGSMKSIKIFCSHSVRQFQYIHIYMLRNWLCYVCWFIYFCIHFMTHVTHAVDKTPVGCHICNLFKKHTRKKLKNTTLTHLTSTSGYGTNIQIYVI